MSWLLFQSTVKSKISPQADTKDFIDALLDEIEAEIKARK